MGTRVSLEEFQGLDANSGGPGAGVNSGTASVFITGSMLHRYTLLVSNRIWPADWSMVRSKHEHFTGTQDGWGQDN